MTVEVRNQLLQALKKIDRPGTFCASGRLPPTLPGLEVVGVGPVALPLEKRQATALKKRAHQAPYGKGTETLVDTDVRRVWEIDADQVALTNPDWADVLKQALRTVQSELGLEKQQLDAHLYKLLLYETGSFFLAHRDGEKLDRMVATLVIALPTAHEGGELIVRHEGQEKTIDFSPESRFHTQFAAFYADCEHAIRPVTSGFRLALIYNLTLERSKATITAPQSSEHIAAVSGILERWKTERISTVGSDEDEPPSKLAIVLDHKYSPAGLAFDALKGLDRAKANVLFAAAQQTGYDAYLALVTYWESGSAEPSGDYGYGRRRRYGYDSEADSDHEMGEVYDESLMANHFRGIDGNPLGFGQIPLDEEEVIADSPLNKGKPDKEDFEGYTGNEGMTLERWYRHAAILLWPAESRFDLLCEAGMDSAVGGLDQMIKQWKQAKKAEQPALKQHCLEFASRIIANWPGREFARHSYHLDDDVFAEVDENEEAVGENASGGKRKPKVSFLPLLETLGEPSLVSAWLRDVMVKDVSVDPGKSLGDICKQHGWLTFQEELRNLFDNTANETIERNARLLADFSLRKDKKSDRVNLCVQLARQLMAAVERWNPRQTKDNWQAKKVNLPEMLSTLAQSFLALEEPELLQRLTTFLLAQPKEFDLTTVQIPALLSLEKWLNRNVKRPSSALHRWLASVLEELETRASHPPQEPTDWRRESATGCSCADCHALSRFLKDPDTKTLRLPLAKARRQHLHNVIDQRKLDTTHVTDRRGSPYTLVCTKTKASFDQALLSHQVDLDHLAKIRKLNEWHDGLKKE